MARHAHAELVDGLGGPTEICRYIKEKTGVDVTTANVSMWRVNGIPHKYRPLLVIMARQLRKKKLVPVDFIFGAAA